MKNTKKNKRKPLSTKIIALAAIEIADKEGLEVLSMRKIGEKLGVEAMSLYHHIPSKEKLMEAMVLELVEELPSLDEPQEWKACLSKTAEHWRELARKHPGTFPLLATRAQTPLPLLERYSSMIKVMVTNGFTHEKGAMILNSFFFGLNGYLLAAGEPTVFRDIPEATQLPNLETKSQGELEKIPTKVWDFASENIFKKHLEFLLAGVAQFLHHKS